MAIVLQLAYVFGAFAFSINGRKGLSGDMALVTWRFLLDLEARKNRRHSPR